MHLGRLLGSGWARLGQLLTAGRRLLSPEQSAISLVSSDRVPLMALLSLHLVLKGYFAWVTLPGGQSPDNRGELTKVYHELLP